MALVARVKQSAITKGDGPKGPYLAPAAAEECDNEEFPDFDDDAELSYGPRGTTLARAATDSPAAAVGLDGASGPFGAMPQSV